MADDDNETWLLDAGQETIEKQLALGYSSLSAIERLTYCLWVADYGMRNSGDMATADDLHPSFRDEGWAAAQHLGLPRSAAAFHLSLPELEKQYFGLFDELVNELKSARRKHLCEGAS